MSADNQYDHYTNWLADKLITEIQPDPESAGPSNNPLQVIRDTLKSLPAEEIRLPGNIVNYVADKFAPKVSEDGDEIVFSLNTSAGTVFLVHPDNEAKFREAVFGAGYTPYRVKGGSGCH